MPLSRRVAGLLGGVLLVAAVACGSDEAGDPPTARSAPPVTPPVDPPPPAPPPEADGPPDATVGASDYVIYCSTCHGVGGAGDGPLANTFDPRPAAHTDGNSMNALSDAYLIRVITEGGGAVGKSTFMAAWGGTLTDRQIRNIVAFLRTIADPPYTPPAG